MSHNHTEAAQENIHEHAHGAKEKWIAWAAVCAAVFAALAAIGGAMASANLTNSMRQQMKANDKWNFYQAKSVKSTLYTTARDGIAADEKKPPTEYESKIKQYKEEMPEIEKEAKEHEELSEKYLETHEWFEFAVTLFHVSIAVVAVGVLTRTPWFWYGSMVSAAAGAVLLVMGFMHGPGHPHEGGKTEGHGPPAATQQHGAAEGHASPEGHH